MVPYSKHTLVGPTLYTLIIWYDNHYGCDNQKFSLYDHVIVISEHNMFYEDQICVNRDCVGPILRKCGKGINLLVIKRTRL